MFRSAEQTNFHNIIKQHMSAPDAPLLLEGGTGLGKTRAYLAAVAASTKRIAIVLPTHTLIDQLLSSKDLQTVGLEVAAFRPASMFETRAEYLEQREKARNARVMVCTAASVIIDQRLGAEYNGSTQRDYIVFDEADQLPDMAALQSDFTIDKEMLKGADLRASLERLSTGRAAEPEVRAAARVMLEILDEPVGYAKVGIDEGNARLHHYLPGRLLKRISNRSSVAFISATLSVGGTFKNFAASMGISDISTLSTCIEPERERHGTLDFTIKPLEVNTEEWFQATVQAARTAAKPVLVATTSHALSDRLKAALAGEEGILIKAGAWAGLDLAEPPRTIIVPQVPFAQPVVIDGEVESSYVGARNVALRRLRQVIGRGLRSPDAVCSVVILDSRAGKLGQFVPVRFTQAWAQRQTFEEGARVEVVLSKAERDPSLRQAALKFHGAKCAVCGESALHRLDVHHLDPVSEGARRTTVRDVVVICKNHHADAHQEMRAARFSAAGVVESSAAANG